MLMVPSRVSMQMSLLMLKLLQSSWSPTSATAKDCWSGSSSYRLWLPTSTPSLWADMPSQQCPAVMTLLEPTMEPPHIKEPPTPRVSMIWWGNSPGWASVPPTILPPPLARGVDNAFLEKERAEATARQAAMTIAALIVNTLEYWPVDPH